MTFYRQPNKMSVTQKLIELFGNTAVLKHNDPMSDFLIQSARSMPSNY